MNAYSTKNKLTFNFITLKGNDENRCRIIVKYNNSFPEIDYLGDSEQLGWGDSDFEAALSALKHQTYLHQEYKKKYLDVLTRLDNAGFTQKQSLEE